MLEFPTSSAPFRQRIETRTRFDVDWFFPGLMPSLEVEIKDGCDAFDDKIFPHMARVGGTL